MKLPSWWEGRRGLWVISCHISSRLMSLWTDNSLQLTVTEKAKSLRTLSSNSLLFPTFSRNGSMYYFCGVFATCTHLKICIGIWKLLVSLNIGVLGSLVSSPPLRHNALILTLLSPLMGRNEFYLRQPLLTLCVTSTRQWWHKFFAVITRCLLGTSLYV